MTLLKFYDPVQTSYQHENGLDAFENLSRHFLSEESPFGTRRTLPRTNIIEDDNGYRIEMALPGIDKKDIRIDHDNGSLTVSVDTQEEKNEEGTRYASREFDYAGATRTFRIGKRVDGDKITANYNQGLLVMFLPIKEEFIPKPARSISVK